MFLLGAVLYEILTGRPPNVGPNLVAVLYRAITASVTPPREAAPERNIPPGIARIAMRAMARAPAAHTSPRGSVAVDGLFPQKR